VAVSSAGCEQTLAAASPDVLREMIRAFALQTMDAKVEVRYGAGVRGVSAYR
jgi:hypothetical protein